MIADFIDNAIPKLDNIHVDKGESRRCGNTNGAMTTDSKGAAVIEVTLADRLIAAPILFATHRIIL